MNTIISWLGHLNVLMRPGHIALVGAGNGKGVWAQWVVHQASICRVTLIEAEPLHFATLQRTLNSFGERAQYCEIRNTLVASQPGTTSFFVASNQQESGLLKPQSLLGLWPNLQMEETKELSAITLDALLCDLGESAEQSIAEKHWLIVDCLPAGELLQASSKLGLVDVVIARVLLGKLQSVPAGASLEEVSELLQRNGMVQIAVEATRHPDIGYALFVCDTRSALHAQVQKHHSECQKLRLKSEDQAKLLRECRAKAEQLTQAKLIAEQQSLERQAQIEHLTHSKTAAEKQSQEQAQQLEQLSKVRDEQAKLAEERQAKIEQLIKAKESEERQIHELSQQIKNVQEQLLVEFEKNLDVQSLFKKQAEDLVRLRKSLDTSLKKAITNASRQMQAFTGLENYWRTGELPTANNETHAWPVSPDFSLYVVTLLEKNNYDLVIEFGTGVSTVVIAKALKKLASKRIGKNPVGFISFDHLEQYYQQTLSMLQQAALGSYVSLHCTPLEDWVAPNGQSYPYYSCQNILEYIATQYSFSGLRILVIVDGPPGATSPHARYPAVPLILRYCTNANIDFLLDDYGRTPEKETVQFWEDDMKNENLKYHSTHLRLEKDACLISVINNKTDSNVN